MSKKKTHPFYNMINYRSPKERKKEYKRQIKNLRSSISYYKSKGYEVNLSYSTTNKPTRKDIEYIYNLNKNLSRNNVITVHPETGEILTPREVNKINREARVRKIKEEKEEEKRLFDASKLVIKNYLRNAYHFPKMAYPKIKGWIDRLIDTQGEIEVAKMINKGYSEGRILTHEIAYDETMLFNYMQEEMNAIGFVGIESDKILSDFDTDFISYD